MSTVISPAINRRSLLSGAASAAAAASFPAAASDSSIANELRLVAAPARWPLVGKPNPSTDVWTYGNRLPGPEIRLRQGEPVRIVVENKLEQDTTVHWHGIRLPNDMDGVPGLTQAPIKPGQKFTYEFTPPDAGTFWYHPHANSLQQLGRGMAGALIVERDQACCCRSRYCLATRGLAAYVGRADRVRIWQPHGRGHVGPYRQYGDAERGGARKRAGAGRRACPPASD